MTPANQNSSARLVSVDAPSESLIADISSFKPGDLFINRELSMLAFNRRVLELAQDEAIPLLERVRFLCISTTNLDEFFEIRVSGLRQQVALGIDTTPPDDGLSPQQQLALISEQTHKLVEDQYRVLNEILFPALKEQGVSFLRRAYWSEEQAAWIRAYFMREILPVLSPMGLDPAHPFPRILNKSLNFIIPLEGKDAFGRDSGLAVVQAPRLLPRLVMLPTEICGGGIVFVFLSSIIHAHVDELFPGMTVCGCHQFRATRNSDLFVDEEEVDDLLKALQGELPSRNYSSAVRLEVADNCPEMAADYLLKQFRLKREDLYQVNGPVNLNRLIAVYDMIDRPDLKYPPYTPVLPPRYSVGDNIFATIARGDILLHHPFQSFAPVVEFIRQAAKDPDVLAIKQTLYRTDVKSQLVELLIEAARAGKVVTVVIELRARFDEQVNIGLANRLQDAGAHVVYGVVGYKSHAKMAQALRRESGKLVRYTHLSTGNYHAGTARAYTDLGLLTCDNDVGEDIHKIFHQLTGLCQVSTLKKLLLSPFTLHKGILERIEREAQIAREGRSARIIARMNALIEPQSIQALYRASAAGVKIDLVVRGMCCLRPGIPGVSDNIEVRSVMGRFLEHSRTFYFRNDGADEVILSSADWMPRNFFRRVEIAFPIEDKELKARVMRESLLNYLADNTQAWQLERDGTYRRLKPPPKAKRRCAQGELLEELAPR